MARVYADYQRERVGWFFGLTGSQLGVLAAASVPVFWLLHRGLWSAALLAAAAWLVVLLVSVMPVNGRTPVGWLVAGSCFLVAHVTGWSAWSSPLAAGEVVGEPEQPNLPGLASGLTILTPEPIRGLPAAAVVRDRLRGTWSVTARLEHPGTAWATEDEHERYGHGLAALLDAAERTGLVTQVIVVVRTTCRDADPARERWIADHRRASPVPSTLARQVHNELAATLGPAASRTETFLTVVVPDRRLRRAARGPTRPARPRHDRNHSQPRNTRRASSRRPGNPLTGRGGGRVGERLTVMVELCEELGGYLRGHLGASRTAWLTSDQLAVACRSGYHPDQALLPEVTQPPDDQHRHHAPAGHTAPSVPWCVAGPANAVPAAGWYRHDKWTSVSSAILLPPRGGRLAGLAPILAGVGVGERRSLMVAFPVMAASAADRRTASREWAADLGEGLRARANVRPRARTRVATAAARSVDAKLVAGATLCRPYAIATSTVPTDLLGTAEDAADAGDGGGAQDQVDGTALQAGRSLEAAIRRAGFGSQRLDLAHDAAFACSCLPLGITPRSLR